MQVGEERAFAAKEEAALGAFLSDLGAGIGARTIPPNVHVETPVAMRLGTQKGYLKLGAYSFCTGPTTFDRVIMGRFCSVAPNVIIGLNEHPIDFLSTHPIAYGRGHAFAGDPYFAAMKQIRKFGEPDNTVIGNDVWIGEGAFIRRGVTIGDGAIVAARAVVLKDVEPYHIVAGVPAKTKRLRFPEPLVEKLKEARWWDLDLRGCAPLDFAESEAAVDKILQFRADGGALLTPPAFEVRKNRETGDWTVRRTA